jgi:hypothetical protein
LLINNNKGNFMTDKRVEDLVGLFNKTGAIQGKIDKSSIEAVQIRQAEAQSAPPAAATPEEKSPKKSKKRFFGLFSRDGDDVPPPAPPPSARSRQYLAPDGTPRSLPRLHPTPEQLAAAADDLGAPKQGRGLGK